MKSLSKIRTYLFAVLFLAIVLSCSKPDGNFQGSEYMPDMGHSIAYEANVNTYYYNNTWGSESDYHKMAQPRKPVAGTVARGYLPSPYKKLADFKQEGDSTFVQMQERVRDLMMNDPELVNAVVPASDDELKQILSRGAHLYGIVCEVCHGENMDGNGILYNDGNGPYKAKPASFISSEFLTATDGRFLNAIMHGKGQMQSHADKLSMTERWEVIHYIRSKQAAEKGETYNPVKVAVNIKPEMEVEAEHAHDDHDGADHH
jgi:mono/diheme cytochrome c family protein